MAKDFKVITEELRKAATTQLELFLDVTKGNSEQAKTELSMFLIELGPGFESVATYVGLGEFEQAQRTLEFYRDAVTLHTARIMLTLADNERVAFNSMFMNILRSMLSFAASVAIP